jgi:hypothetical protein
MEQVLEVPPDLVCAWENGDSDDVMDQIKHCGQLCNRWFLEIHGAANVLLHLPKDQRGIVISQMYKSQEYTHYFMYEVRLLVDTQTAKLSCGVDVIKGASNVLSLLPEEQRESVVSQMGFLCHDDLLLSPEETRQLFDLVEDN